MVIISGHINVAQLRSKGGLFSLGEGSALRFEQYGPGRSWGVSAEGNLRVVREGARGSSRTNWLVGETPAPIKNGDLLRIYSGGESRPEIYRVDISEALEGAGELAAPEMITINMANLFAGRGKEVELFGRPYREWERLFEKNFMLANESWDWFGAFGKVTIDDKLTFEDREYQQRIEAAKKSGESLPGGVSPSAALRNSVYYFAAQIRNNEIIGNEAIERFIFQVGAVVEIRIIIAFMNKGASREFIARKVALFNESMEKLGENIRLTCE
ncbi:MAG: hypothetical protein ABIH56_07225 [Candidatus Margulisiibacteriota bacterium]